MAKQIKMNEKIVILDELTLGQHSGTHRLSDFGKVTSYPYTLPNDRIACIKGNSIVVTNKVIIDKAVMDACPEVKLICLTATGMNNVDLEYARQKGIAVMNVAGYSTQSVAQSAFAMLFHLMHRYTYYDAYVKSGAYAKSPIFTHQKYSFFELKGKTFGIVGLGSIGKEVAKMASAFGCHVVYYSTSGKNINTGYQQIGLDGLLEGCNMISIHCPLNDQTKDLFTYERMKTMKQDAYLLNLGRGGIVNEAGLAKVLDEGHLAGAALDVLEREPILADNPLLKVKNSDKLLILPHIAWTSTEAKTQLMDGVYGNIKKFLLKDL
jgi:lactate dehydrogenase-like 2-hydroxyacid dehydrogenase